MKRLLIVAAIGLIAAPAFAGPDVLPVTGMRDAIYNMATGEVTAPTGNERYGASVWASTQRTGYFFGQQSDGEGITTLDWGDIAGPQAIGGFAISYSTDVELPNTIDCVVMFFADENGFNSVDRTYLAGFDITELPTADPAGAWNGWTVTLDLDANFASFTIDGADLDTDGLMDFGYTYWFHNLTPTTENATGPTMAGDPNAIPQTAPGIENVFDYFTDPNLENYEATYWFGGTPYAQFYMELFDHEGNDPVPSCPNPGASGNYCTADIDGSADCIVDLADLAQLLANYGMTSGAEPGDGDIDGDDGDVDLADLAALLGQYGDDCN